MRPSRQSAGKAATLAAFMAILLVGFTLPTGAQAQSQPQAQTPAEWDAAREEMSRAELEALLQRLETEAQSTAYSQRLREEARRSADLVRARLTEGDFQVGDRIVLMVQQQPEMSDTLTVRSGRVVTIPVVGDLSLAGVLRAELNDYMHEHVSRYVRDPTVRTETLIRVLVQGAVGSPGFYLVPADRLMTDVLTLAGGPGANADLSDVRVERGEDRIWEGEALRTAIIQGRTLDHLNIQAGDRIFVPTRIERSTWEIVRNVTGVIGTLATLTYALTRIF
jgi:protein involved in polysaccharide export with SLBB domain